MSNGHTQSVLADVDNVHASSPIRDLLPPGATIPPRYHRVAAQLQDWGLPENLMYLGLIMRQLERGTITPAQLAPLLGNEAAAVGKALVVLSGSVPRPSLQQSEQAWRLFTLTYLHPSASLLKVAELLAQLRAMQDSHITIRDETMTAAAHVCARLGMWDIRAEILDAQIRLADPHLVRRSVALLERSLAKRTQFFESLCQWLTDLLQAQGIVAHIERRPRAIHQVVEDGLESVHSAFPWADVIVLLIEDMHDCYRALGVINMAAPVVGSRVRDFLGGPKDNGYQAIHTTIAYTTAVPTERTASVDIRITTAAMDRYNRNGYLAYLAGVPVPPRRPLWWTDRQRWLAAYEGEATEVFVFTPKGEAIFLPRGATVLDFAVRVHSKLGIYCRGAKVNENHASPADRLECGDICEVVIDPYREPIHHRLLNHANTTSARSRIRRALQKDHTGAVRGHQIFREVLTQRLAEQEVHTSEALIDQQVASICRMRGYQTVEAFYRAVARGEAAPDPVVRMIISNLLVPRLDLDQIPTDIRTQSRRIRLALCCRPRPSHAVVAVPIHKGHELKIHSIDCAHVIDPAYPIAWRPTVDHTYVADVLYESWDRPGLIHQVTGVLAQTGSINILSLNATVPEPSLARICFSFEAPDQTNIDQVRRALEQLPEQRNVEVRTINLIDEGVRVAEPLKNPYGPQPVSHWPFFVGRAAEIQQILTQISGKNRTNHILIRGPKRIGKSSLLQHLSRYHLQDFEVPGLLDLQSVLTEDLHVPRLLERIATMIERKVGSRIRHAALDTEALARDPVTVFGSFLRDLRQQNDLDRFVILIDESGVVASRLQDDAHAAQFFDQWRALLNDATISKHLVFVVVLPDQSGMYLHTSNISSGAVSQPLRLGELGHPIRLSVLNEENARDLITTPIHAHLVYRNEDLALVLHETGSHPYYIHLVCGAIVTKMQVLQRNIGLHIRERQEIPSDIVRSALDDVFNHEDAFYHIMADSTADTRAVLSATALSTSEQCPQVSRSRVRSRLRRIYPQYNHGMIARALVERPDLFYEIEEQIGIRVALIARWLRRRVQA